MRVPGMPAGRGRRVPDEWKVTDPELIFGQGNSGDPQVIWVYNFKDLEKKERVIRRCTEIAREEAQKLGMSYVWIRNLNHPYKSHYVTPGTRVMLYAQPHITVAFGTDVSTRIWEGHVYTKDMADKSGAPQRILEASELEEKGGNPQLWASGPYPYHNLPNDYPYPFLLNPKDEKPVYKMPAPEFYTEAHHP
ncbi:hypothetical protein F5Y05DRAFT_412267 [Hypoxylon sp. FL0543]|nr:hypothetical protein F5Y05DRAFT_412267 [Hypoxylon sp. FL0543]